MIPKVIHYIWLGRGEFPPIVDKCVESWKKFCPDYEIKLWTEDNLDINLCPYVRQAYDAKKFAFASDVFRYYILEKEGGIYLDVDVELLKPIDELLKHQCFMGVEDKWTVAPGLIIGAEPHNPDIKNMLEDYYNENFINEKGEVNLLTICKRSTNYYKKLGLKCDGSIESVSTTTIYPKEYFNPTDLNTQKVKITDKTYSIHHYNASWYTPKLKFKRRVKTVLNKLSFGLFGKILEKIKYKKQKKEEKLNNGKNK